MSVRCKSCGMESADGAAWCDFCKEPFVKKPKAAATPPPAPAPEPAAPPPELAGITKEKVEELDVDKLLKPASEPPPAAPPWLRPIAWVMLGLIIVTGTIALFALQRRYMERLPAGPAPEPPPLTRLPPQPPPPPANPD